MIVYIVDNFAIVDIVVIVDIFYTVIIVDINETIWNNARP